MTDLVARGQEKIAWARAHMPVLAEVGRELRESEVLAGLRVAISIHLEAKTACLALTLQEAGAAVSVTGSNPLSTQDDVAAALAAAGLRVHARRGASAAEYREHLTRVLEIKPQLVLDDGGDLTALLHGECAQLGESLIGICEETTTGVLRLRGLSREGKLRWPALAVNDARMKHLFDNRYGTGQSTWDAIMRATNLLVAGKRVVVAGYGWCGRGIALRAHGLGARVTVCEVDPVRAAEAMMDGFSVAHLAEAIRGADFLITATGCRDVVRWEHLLSAKDGLVLANAGHFDVEIDVRALRERAQGRRVRENVEEFLLPGERRVYLLAEGRLVNLVAGDGHPVEIMDLSFALQALSLAWLAREGRGLSPGVYPVPEEVDERVARLFLRSRGVEIDSLTPGQREYLGL
ncbi:adenosylhomocysteinase [Candidatus Bipolaricaulota bacterium]|nr:adenosylhomocysteinase [Candidatus Bipolaricaulota bacterium]